MKLNRPRVLWLILAAVVLLAGLWSARRFQEQWFAIPSRGGESFTIASLRTPHYRQHDPRWAEERIGGFGESLGSVGCTVCSLAMALEYYGIRMTPKELNDFLKANEGFNPRGWLRWNCVDKVSGGRLAMDYMGRPDHAVIDRALRHSQPVLIKVYIHGVVPHWVLIVGKVGEEYLMRDPLGEEGAIGSVSQYESKIFAVRILRTR